MKLGEFIQKYTHNNIIRLVYKAKRGHETVGEDWSVTSMDWEVNAKQGPFRHYVNNEVLGLASICFTPDIRHHESLNIVIERLENQPYVEEVPRNFDGCVVFSEEVH